MGRKTFLRVVTGGVALSLVVAGAASGKKFKDEMPPVMPLPTCGLVSHPGTNHDSPSKHAHACNVKKLGELEVSKDAGLGQIELHGKIGAVLQRDEGAVALLDLKNPAKPKVLGRYDDDIADSFDGDLAFSDDGRWLIYARQTHQFSKDGLHVLDVSDPKAPRLAFYQPQGGAFRVAYYKDGSDEYVVSMDAVTGLVVNRFESTTGALVPVYADPLPIIRKVGGPASAGILIEKKDPKTKKPLL